MPLSAAAQKAQEDYASASFVLQQAHDELDELYNRSENLSLALRQKDADLESARIHVSMLESTHQQLEGQAAVLRGNMDNNHANITRVQEELKSQEDRSGGIAAQMEQVQQRIARIEEETVAKRRNLSALQQELATMIAGAQGITRQFLQWYIIQLKYLLTFPPSPEAE